MHIICRDTVQFPYLPFWTMSVNYYYVNRWIEEIFISHTDSVLWIYSISSCLYRRLEGLRWDRIVSKWNHSMLSLLFQHRCDTTSVHLKTALCMLLRPEASKWPSLSQSSHKSLAVTMKLLSMENNYSCLFHLSLTFFKLCIKRGKNSLAPVVSSECSKASDLQTYWFKLF